MDDNNKNAAALMPLLTFLVLALCLLLVLLMGAGSYRRLVEQGQEQYNARTAVQYVATRLRQAEEIQLTAFGTGDALVLPQTVEGERYVTYVYCHNGCLRELYCREGAPLTPEDGEAVLEADGLTLSLEEDVLTVTISGQTLMHCLRTGKEAP